MYHLEELKNGLRIAAHSMPGKKSMAVGIWVRVGGRYESKRLSGISHFVEHMLLKSTKKYDSKKKIRDAVKEIGAYRNGLTSRDRVWYPIRCLDEYFVKGGV